MPELTVRTACGFIDCLNSDVFRLAVLRCGDIARNVLHDQELSDFADFNEREIDLVEAVTELTAYPWLKRELSPHVEVLLGQIRESAEFRVAVGAWPTSLRNGDRFVMISKRVALSANSLDSRSMGLEDIAVEGMLDWLLSDGMKASPPHRCAFDGRYFVPKIRSAARFCSNNCRFSFNNLRTSLTTFVCVDCKTTRNLEDFSGLTVEPSLGHVSTIQSVRYEDTERVGMGCILDLEELQDSGEHRISSEALCLPCVRKNHREWNAYASYSSPEASGRRKS